jgi:hypothetical protein
MQWNLPLRLQGRRDVSCQDNHAKFMQICATDQNAAIFNKIGFGKIQWDFRDCELFSLKMCHYFHRRMPRIPSSNSRYRGTPIRAMLKISGVGVKTAATMLMARMA